MRIAFYVQGFIKNRFILVQTFNSWAEIMAHSDSIENWNSLHGRKQQSLILHIPGTMDYPKIIKVEVKRDLNNERP